MQDLGDIILPEQVMMRIVLIFPPKASATYVPLGIASLAPYIEQTVAKASVALLDLNISTWLHLASIHSQGKTLLDFVQGKNGEFFNKDASFSHKIIWDTLRQQMESLSSEAKLYAETGETRQGYAAILKNQAELILSTDPEIVGFSVMFPDQLPFAAALARAVKDISRHKGFHSGAHVLKVVLGGASMSSLSTHELLVACPSIDGIVVGEGEAAVSALCSGADWSSIPGLVYRAESGFITNQKPPTLSLKKLPVPDFSRLPLDQYFNPVPVLPVLFSRGCSWRKCRFCSHNFAFSGYRKKEVETFVDELEYYSNTFNARHLYSADECIGPADMDAITASLKARGLDIAFHVLGKPTEEYTSKRLSSWASAGCRWIGWGVESGSQRLLDLINKGTKVSVIEQVLKASADAGISNLAMMIFGLPTSSDQDLSETFGFLERVYDAIDAMSASAFVLFEGTHFARNALRYALHIDGSQALLCAGGNSVHSHRLKFREISADGSLRSPRGALEVSSWIRQRRWLGDPPLLEQLPCEHYLLHTSKGHGLDLRPIKPPAQAA